MLPVSHHDSHAMDTLIWAWEKVSGHWLSSRPWRFIGLTYKALQRRHCLPRAIFNSWKSNWRGGGRRVRGERRGEERGGLGWERCWEVGSIMFGEVLQVQYNSFSDWWRVQENSGRPLELVSGVCGQCVECDLVSGHIFWICFVGTTENVFFFCDHSNITCHFNCSIIRVPTPYTWSWALRLLLLYTEECLWT